MYLTLSDILAKEDRPLIYVPCPEWGGTVIMEPFSGDDRDWYDQMQCDKRWPENSNDADWRGLRAAAVARAMCDEDRRKTEATPADVLALGAKNGAALDRCFVALRDASGLGGGAAEDAEKN